MTYPEVKIEKITVKGNTRRLGKRIKVVKSGFRKYVCFYPIDYVMEKSETFFMEHSLDLEDELVKQVISDVERTRND